MLSLNCCRSLLYVQRMSKTKSTLFGFVTGTIGEAPYRDQCNPVLSILSSSFRCKKNKGVGLRGKVSFYLFCSGLPWSNTCVSVHWSSCWAAFWLHIWRKDSQSLYVGPCKTTRSPIFWPKHASCLNELVRLRGNFFTATPNGRKE